MHPPANDDPVLAVKPLLRGVLHQCAAFTALGAGLVMAATAPTLRGTYAALGFMTSLLLCFGVSATYHRITWTPSVRAWWRRADHAMIFVLIAGTYTPMALVALPASFGNTLLIIVWSGAAVGVIQSLFWIHAPKWVAAVLCVALGWTVMLYWSEAKAALTSTQIVLILAGGVVYTVGAVFYALKRPNPIPGIFGHHELFHLCTIIAAVLHFISILSMIQGAR